MVLERWEIDSGHSGIQFSVRHLGLARIRGTFTRWSGTFSMEDGDLYGASLRVLIDASSVATGLAERDAHLRTADFLDTGRFLEMTFDGRVEPGPRIVGELSALGRTCPLAFDLVPTGCATDPWGNRRAGFAARGVLDRRDLGCAWNQPLASGAFLLGDQVTFEIDVEAVLQPCNAPSAPGNGSRPPLTS